MKTKKIQESNLSIVQSGYSEKDLAPSNLEFDITDSLWNNYKELKPIQQKGLTLLISGESISSVAKTLGVERHTIYAWLQDELFSECYQKWQKRLLIDTYHLQKQVYQKALKSLDIMLNNPQDLEQYFEVVKFVIQNLKP
jgi:hypothetical protein